MRSPFKFKKEIGFAELIAALALVLSGFAVWQAQQATSPFVILGLGDNRVGAFRDEESNTCKMLLHAPVEFNNSGQRSATLDRISSPIGVPAVWFLKNGELVKDVNISFDVYLLRAPLEHIEVWPVLSKGLRPISFSETVFLSKIIPPNSSLTLNFVVTAEIYEGLNSIADQILLGMDVSDQGGKTHEIRIALELDHISTRACA